MAARLPLGQTPPLHDRNAARRRQGRAPNQQPSVRPPLRSRKRTNCLARNSYKKLEALITRARFIPKGYSFKILAAELDGHFPRRPHFQALSKLAQLALHMAADPEHAFSRDRKSTRLNSSH